MFHVKPLCCAFCSIFLQAVYDRTRITLGRHSAGKAEKIPLFQTMIMQIGFTSKEINSLPQLWGLKLQNNLCFENFENLPKEKIT